MPLPSDFDERFNLVMLGLRKDPRFEDELKKFKGQAGGLKLSGISNKLKSGVSSAKSRFNNGLSSANAMISSPSDEIPAATDTPASLAPAMDLDSEDWMGPRIRWFLGAITSPYARVMLRGLFMVIFFISYLEAIPVFGSILSSGLDIMIAGSKALTKTIQKQIPIMMGLIPIPFASLIGIVMAGIYGTMVWPMIAMVAFSRQDFTAAIESFLRVIPPPIGDTIADLFLEGNRVVARLDAKRQKLASDITTAIATIADIIENISTKVSNGISKVSSQIEKASEMKDAALGKINSQVEKVKQLKDNTVGTINTQVDRAKQLKEDTFGNVNEVLKEVNEQPVAEKSSLQDAFSDIKQSPPTTSQITSSLRNLSSQIKESAKPRTEFEPTPVGQGRRKRLTTRRRGTSKWTKTQRTKYVKH